MKPRKLGLEIHTLDLLFKRNADSCETIRQNDALTGTHGYILGYLSTREGEDVYQRDIERTFSIRRSSASQVLQLMEKNGLIERKSVDADARLKKICTTPKGKRLHAETICALMQIEEKAMAGIDKEQADVFYLVVDQIKRNLGGQANCFVPAVGKTHKTNVTD